MKTIILAAATVLAIASPVSFAFAQTASDTPKTEPAVHGAAVAHPGGSKLSAEGAPAKDPKGAESGSGSSSRAAGTSKSQD